MQPLTVQIFSVSGKVSFLSFITFKYSKETSSSLLIGLTSDILVGLQDVRTEHTVIKEWHARDKVLEDAECCSHRVLEVDVAESGYNKDESSTTDQDLSYN